MSVHELNQLMTYVVEGWMLFSAGFIGTTFVSFVSKRIQEDIAAAELAQAESQIDAQADSQTVAPSEGVAEVAKVAVPNEQTDEVLAEEIDIEEATRLEEVAAVSKKLAKEKEQQPSGSSVSVST